ncbi:MAG TPA: CoA transferase [Streptosporangiaceae bacterium]
MLERCPVLAWAASGAMALTGYPDGEPVMSPAPALALLGRVTDQLAEATLATGNPVRADPAVLLTARAALAGFTRHGRISLGGAARLLRAADGWCAVTLSRTDDIAAVPAILAGLGVDGPEPTGIEQAWNAIEAAAFASPAEALATAVQSLGVPAAVLPQGVPSPGSSPWPPWQVTRISAPSPAGRLAGAVIADLSSMWAGPLCARLLGLAGARIIKVETPDRPDGARTGNRRFFDWLHAGHQSLLADFRTQSGRAALAALLATADVVIEASRPRALANLGLAPETIPHKDGQVWLSITGYGRAEPGQVAFGDDAAVAGGLVGWAGVPGQAEDEPVFCADAIADPLTGVCGALAVARSLAEGGGQLIDISLRGAAASFAAAPPLDHGPHYVRPDGTVSCPQSKRDHAVLLPRSPELAGRSAQLGADTDAVLAWLATC